MNILAEYEGEWLYGLRWVARIGSIASIALILLIITGEGLNPERVGANEWIGLMFFPVGVVAGMIIAWYREGLGGAISVISLLCFYMIYGLMLNNRFWQGSAFIVFSLPGFLFLLYRAIFYLTLERGMHR